MEDPVREIPSVISQLVSTPPQEQASAIEKYFTPNAQFTHPFCRTGSYSNSRYLISRIYRWYKIMSPRISARVTSVSFDEANGVLYVGMTQVFAIWAVPTHRSEVSLVTVLHLERLPARSKEEEVRLGGGKWLITSQNDLYQTDQFVKFILPWFWMLVPLWQLVATWVCVLMSYVFFPVTWYEEKYQHKFTRDEKPPAWNDAR
ncbi:hypothetical protein AAFC00_002064 [Neodothiora populina]|uniref:SigF-like NTF2-like domain-containing protein n=1 Tax=Neodothiora populina TaxID=2781224 RepID=A0ABR3PG92_9PEZI